MKEKKDNLKEIDELFDLSLIGTLFSCVSGENEKALNAINMQHELNKYKPINDEEEKEVNDALCLYIFDAGDLLNDSYYDDTLFDRLYKLWEETASREGKKLLVKVFDIVHIVPLKDYLKLCLYRLTDDCQIEYRAMIKELYERTCGK